ncbi:3'-5' exonuclease [Spirulina sp. CS-785/01]|uniref:3'-5' exonuclease n=1 Tax=Spirulina sp. CS-785/01 TaxID=3021716 RepID=UPI00232EA161|nr:3'-5' exonuclease [Spirulina sp. CS-785/01]MDB9314953.1 3'-5' exonuclease [Spirulina sp. CS-785/01]
MEILVIDTETTGLDPESDNLIEIAAILWSLNYRSVLIQVSTLVKYDREILNPAEPINKILPALLGKEFPYQSALELINKISCSAKYICAHNADFDKEFCKKAVGLKIPLSNWIDTQDIRYPKSKYCQGTSLNNLAIAHGIPIVDAHRALDDCRTLTKLLSIVPNLEEELKRASRPKILVKSLEEKPGTLSKMHGFKWHSIIPYSWAKYMPEEDIVTLPFSAVKVFPDESINPQEGRSQNFS